MSKKKKIRYKSGKRIINFHNNYTMPKHKGQRRVKVISNKTIMGYQDSLSIDFANMSTFHLHVFLKRSQSLAPKNAYWRGIYLRVNKECKRRNRSK